MQIAINVSDDGQITVEAEGREPYMCESAQECFEYLSDMLPSEQPEEGEAQAMWDEEAAKRPPMSM